MTAKKENLMKFAKGEDKKTKTPAKKKEVQEKVLTPEEERDLKAKEKVASLLEGVDLTLKKTDDLLEMDNAPKVGGDYQWLEEQVQKLTEENERLNSEAAVAKADYAKIFETLQQLKNGVTLGNPSENNDIRLKVTQLFNEIQSNHLAMGKNFIIHPPSFLLRLLMFFPFLEKEKRF
jgi:hypothetical protein